MVKVRRKKCDARTNVRRKKCITDVNKTYNNVNNKEA